jgi:hypothetical protein
MFLFEFFNCFLDFISFYKPQNELLKWIIKKKHKEEKLEILEKKSEILRENYEG